MLRHPAFQALGFIACGIAAGVSVLAVSSVLRLLTP
jgi:hypothetical protein